MVRTGEYPGTNMMWYEFQLRRGVTIRLVLPKDLTKRDVARLTRYLKALVLETA